MIIEIMRSTESTQMFFFLLFSIRPITLSSVHLVALLCHRLPASVATVSFFGLQVNMRNEGSEVLIIPELHLDCSICP